MHAVSDAAESVFETVEAIGEFIEGLVQVGGDLLSLARDVFGWLEAGVGYIERLMDLAESGTSLVNGTAERVAPPP